MPKTMESSSPATQKPRTANGQPTQQAIALRAYHLYLERGGAPGNELEDWIQAEIQLALENGKSRRKATAKSAAA
jgi:hypothetical protein